MINQTGERTIDSPKTYQAIINGKRFAFTEDTSFKVQLGRGAKGAYKTYYTFKGPALSTAIRYYQCMNIGNGYKKRLIIDGDRHTLLARETS